MSKEVIDHLTRMDEKLTQCLVELGQVKEQVKSNKELMIYCQKKNRDDLKIRFKIVWSAIGAFSSYLIALTYKVWK